MKPVVLHRDPKPDNIVRRDLKPVNRDAQVQPPVSAPKIMVTHEPSPGAKDRLAELLLELLDERGKSGGR